MEEYGLDEYDIDPGAMGYDFPAVRLAEHQDPAVLKDFLLHGWEKSPWYRSNDSTLAAQYGPNAFSSGRSHGAYDSPLLRAISCHLTENVKVLLEAGADANGQHLMLLVEYALLFTHSSYGDSHFAKSLPSLDREETLAELLNPEPARTASDDQIGFGITRFWSAEEFPPLTVQYMNGAETAIELAAGEGLNEVIDILIENGADYSFWGEPRTLNPEDPKHSTAAVSTPLHKATLHNKLSTLKLLLSKYKMDPNVFPLVAATRCMTPLMQAVATNPPNFDAMDILLADDRIELEARTPIFGVRVLHFAVAQLNIKLIDRITAEVILDPFSSTLRGHTLLHIACLPLDDSHINLFCPEIYQSIRFVRTLSTSWVRRLLSATCTTKNAPGFHGRSPDQGGLPFPPASTSHFDAQTEVVKLLLNSVPAQKHTDLVASKDIDGNTCLHYLAAGRTLNWDAIDVMRRFQDADGSNSDLKNLWDTAVNKKGFTPADLEEAGRSIVEAQHLRFWPAELGMSRSVGDASARKTDEQDNSALSGLFSADGVIMPCFGCNNNAVSETDVFVEEENQPTEYYGSGDSLGSKGLNILDHRVRGGGRGSRRGRGRGRGLGRIRGWERVW